VNNKDSGKRPKVKLLSGLLMFLTGWTIPEEEITIIEMDINTKEKG